MRSEKLPGNVSRGKTRAGRQPPLIEALENRALFSALFPNQISQAYGFNQITFSGGSVIGNGAGQTIAIIGVDHDATLSTDLTSFDGFFGLNNPGPTTWNLSVVGQDGGAVPSMAATSNDLFETSLDVEWAHALAPGANILLVEANSSISSDVQAAALFAAGSPGVSVVSTSHVGVENTKNDNFYSTPSGHQGVTFVAASGDNGTVTYPSSSPGVVAVGGTSLIISDASGTYGSESAWGGTPNAQFGSGGGMSAIESEPAYQRGVQSSGSRETPDVSFYADPSDGGYAIIAGGQQISLGGTSGGAPAWAALFAIADQGRAINGLTTLNSGSQTLPMLYALYGTPFYADAFHDITTGTNGFGISAGPGYDMATGLGSPQADFIAEYLAGNITIPEPKAGALAMLALMGVFLKRPARSASAGTDSDR